MLYSTMCHGRSVVSNARKLLELDRRYGEFQKYLRSRSSFQELVKDMKSQFKFLESMGAYHFLCAVGEEVPPWEGWRLRQQ